MFYRQGAYIYSLVLCKQNLKKQVDSQMITVQLTRDWEETSSDCVVDD